MRGLRLAYLLVSTEDAGRPLSVSKAGNIASPSSSAFIRSIVAVSRTSSSGDIAAR